MWGKKGSVKKKDPKKVASALRRALTGEDLVQEPLKGVDLSKFSVEQLQAIWDIKQRDISDDEKREEIDKILNDGLPSITRFVMVHNDEVITMAKKPGWFDRTVRALRTNLSYLKSLVDIINIIRNWF